MGKGDKKTAKGKRVMGSYGNSRKRKTAVVVPAKTEKPKKEVKAEVEKKVTVKKVKEKETTAKAEAPKKATTKKTSTKKEA